MQDKDVPNLSFGVPIGKIIAEELDKMIAKDIIEVIKKYFPKSTINEQRIVELARMIVKNEKGGE